MVGIENIKKVVLLGAEALNVGSKLLHGGGILSLLSLVDEVNGIKSLDKVALIQEIKDLSPEERGELENLFKEKLSLEDKSVELKIESGIEVAEKAVSLAYKALSVVNEGKALVEEVKSILG